MPVQRPQTFFARQRVPLLIATFLGGTAAFVSFKFRAVMTRSEEVKKATSGTKANYSVVPGRSGGGV